MPLHSHQNTLLVNLNIILSLICSLIKEENQRPKYNRLLEHPFIKGIDQNRAEVAEHVCEILEAMERNGVSPFTTDQPAQAWVD